ncbi:ComF family protein [Methylovulum psychrotolerans]|uniref:ComF family protein n=1 Tax=Methylovulum psychrotolerans TaxID=1704499 RepID=UPI001BFF3B5F|nr:ComF family protein [Methylovulum psychrotolerans]MBT9099028.1 ComF family protein [Methylovulum psychrotolerans]
MQVKIQRLLGRWDRGYSLDKHTISSTYLGIDEYGYDRFETLRTEVGEALFKLKYRSDRRQAVMLATQLATSLGGHLKDASFVIPMPPSKQRPFQPVEEIAKQVAELMGIPYIGNLLIKTADTPQVKNIPVREERIRMLCAALQVNDVLPEGAYNALIIDDLYDTGSSLEAATHILKQYVKIQKVLVATLTRKNP